MTRALMIPLLIHALAWGEVRVTPVQATLPAGSSCTFAATLDGAQPPGGWRWSIRAGQGQIDERSGLYQAPAGSAAVRVRAELRSDPATSGEATALVLPLPAELAGLAGQALGGQPHVGSLPFLDLETGARPLPEGKIIRAALPEPPPDRAPLLAGCGIPFPFAAEVTQLVALDGCRITYREGSDWIRLDTDHPGWPEMVLRGRVEGLTLEALKRSAERPGHCRTTSLHYPVDVRRVHRSALSMEQDEEVVVADSGNHAIRIVGPDGKVATLAGTPGRAGYRDSGFGNLAAFNDPQGLAADGEGRVYVADRGNRVIRIIHPDGAVATLAGRPFEAGAEDSAEAPARFTDLKALCLHPRMAALYVLDGHAVRLVYLPGGEVTTLMGVVGTPGFREIGADASRDQPCLRDPTGIACAREGMVIADHGNHAVRMISWDGHRLWTLAGDPAAGETRWGLVRDGLTGPLGEDYATLEGPWTVASGLQGREPRIFTTTGSCLAEVRHELAGRREVRLITLEPFLKTAVGTTCGVTIRLEGVRGRVRFTAEFLDPGGERRARVQRWGEGGGTMLFDGQFTQAGRGRVVVRGVSDQGVSAQAEMEVEITP